MHYSCATTIVTISECIKIVPYTKEKDKRKHHGALEAPLLQMVCADMVITHTHTHFLRVTTRDFIIIMYNELMGLPITD